MPEIVAAGFQLARKSLRLVGFRRSRNPAGRIYFFPDLVGFGGMSLIPKGAEFAFRSYIRCLWSLFRDPHSDIRVYPLLSSHETV
jgi:hypothetical protein